jgi:hypothetical protein
MCLFRTSLRCPLFLRSSLVTSTSHRAELHGFISNGEGPMSARHKAAWGFAALSIAGLIAALVAVSLAAHSPPAGALTPASPSNSLSVRLVPRTIVWNGTSVARKAMVSAGAALRVISDTPLYWIALSIYSESRLSIGAWFLIVSWCACVWFR